MIQIIAMLSMLIDHLGVLYEVQWFRVVGRLSMPLYAFLVAYSFGCTNDRKRYIKRLFTISVLSQAFFCSALRIEEFKLNVVFVWAFAVFWLDLYENKNKVLYILTPIYVLFVLAVNVDYGIIGFGWVLFWYFKYKEKLKSPYDTAILMMLCFISPLQAFSIISYPLAVYCKKHNKVRCKNRLIKYIYRWFYPAHLALLTGLQC